MTWSALSFDSTTGLIADAVELTSFSWSVSVGDCTLATTRDKGTGEGEVGGLRLPWAAVPGSTPEEQHDSLAMYRRGLALLWDGAPVVAGLVGERSGTREDVSLSLVSPLEMLSHRYAVREGAFGTGEASGEDGAVGPVTTDSVRLTGLSYRAIVCELVRLACSKPGGALPIDLPYLGERGTHERTYDGFNVANGDVRTLVENVCDLSGGPDICLRPYVTADGMHLRWELVAGSDAEPHIGDSPVTPVLTCHPGGGTAQGLEWAELAPAMRVYATGAGQDKAMLCHLSEDLSLCQGLDPWPLLERRVSGSSDWATADLVRGHADSALAALRSPQVQLRCRAHASAVPPGTVWPGQRVLLDLEGMPAWPDGRYALRLMEMSGDEGDVVTLTFDQMPDPWEGVA